MIPLDLRTDAELGDLTARIMIHGLRQARLGLDPASMLDLDYEFGLAGSGGIYRDTMMDVYLHGYDLGTYQRRVLDAQGRA